MDTKKQLKHSNDHVVNNKVALVTGASRGIGKAIAEQLILAGITVVGTATTENGAETINKNLHTFINNNISNNHANNAIEKSCGVVLDLANRDSIVNAINHINETLDPPLILINNAGINRDGLFLRMTEENWLNVINTNLSGVFRITKCCVKGMLKASWGRIINISSIVAFSGNPGQVNYTATKAGIIGFSKSLAQELASRRITVNVVAPGFIDTDMTKALPDSIKEKLLAKIPIGRLGNVNDVARAVMFLVDDSAGYITGNTIHVNGGMLMS